MQIVNQASDSRKAIRNHSLSENEKQLLHNDADSWWWWLDIKKISPRKFGPKMKQFGGINIVNSKISRPNLENKVPKILAGSLSMSPLIPWDRKDLIWILPKKWKCSNKLTQLLGPGEWESSQRAVWHVELLGFPLGSGTCFQKSPNGSHHGMHLEYTDYFRWNWEDVF